jgi:hypothetical protein
MVAEIQIQNIAGHFRSEVLGGPTLNTAKREDEQPSVIILRQIPAIPPLKTGVPVSH